MRKAENCLQFFNEVGRGGCAVGKLVGWEVHKFLSSCVCKFRFRKIPGSEVYMLCRSKCVCVLHYNIKTVI